MSHPDDEPALDVTHGDVALSRHLRRSLRILRDRSDNEQFHRLVDDVLSGQVGLREVCHTDAFAAGVGAGVREFARRWERLSDAEREELAEPCPRPGVSGR
ncbi:hypothetical protein Q0Z83_063150 [Actinoplanes sichuanensis]|uniref:Uncharacterized protein n=1 Tax=Actinoplanes sichuanensis TaxID=512349 RepID=A0ABW3ZZN7_9ACTN|nr:hypothetical protein [Actinoplanes sichuanensis]BEL08124.1 hypothetical protein Q0Z83_063150 [Actinoplanes sichuanensis]